MSADRKLEYSMQLFYSQEDEGYIALVPDLPGCSAFGDTPEEALTEIRDAIEAWIAAAKKAGNPIPAPSERETNALPSGKILARLPKTLHALLLQRADRDGISLNTSIVNLLSFAIGAEVKAASEVKAGARAHASSYVSDVSTFVRMITVAAEMRQASTVGSAGRSWISGETTTRSTSEFDLIKLPANTPVLARK